MHEFSAIAGCSATEAADPGGVAGRQIEAQQRRSASAAPTSGWAAAGLKKALLGDCAY
jgi:hypothetical protein